MSTQVKLKALVSQQMSALISTYQWQLAEISENEIQLKAKNYTIAVILDREGVSLVYFDDSSNPPKGYNLFLYLSNKRRDRLIFKSEKQIQTSRENFIEEQLKSLTQHLKNAGGDILQGSKDWLKDYSGPIINSRSD